MLLDSPLSAVDQHTMTHIFNYCIKGLLAKKTVILINHQLNLLPRCDAFGIMKNGELIYFGPYGELVIPTYYPGMQHAFVEDITKLAWASYLLKSSMEPPPPATGEMPMKKKETAKKEGNKKKSRI